MSQLVTSAEELQRVCDRLHSEPVVVVDTEFLWERTYYPILGLVQVAVSDGTCWLLDPIQLPTLQPFGEILASESSVKILHDALQDLTILVQCIQRTTGALYLPRNIFDTRLSAGFCGFPSTISLKKLLESVMNIRLEKTETRSNWTRRPLTPMQLEYASDDVLYLPELRVRLMRGCASPTVLRWMAEENRKYESEELYRGKDPMSMWTRVKGFTRALMETERPKRARFLSVLQEIAAWREGAARDHDRPRHFIISDELLVEIARHCPQNEVAVSRLPNCTRRFRPDILDGLLKAVKAGLARDPSEAPQWNSLSLSIAERDALRTKCKQQLEEIALRCAPYRIDPQLVISRDHLEAILTDRAGNTLASGWRKELLG